MVKKAELFHLIQSLSRNEKRHFRLQCSSSKEGSNYLRLFDAIDRQQSYDEESIKALFEGETFVRQLTATKNYLRNLILKSLRNYHSGMSKSAELKDIVRNIEILFHKGLFKLCASEIRRGERIADACEEFTTLYEIRAWERRLIQAVTPYDYAGLSRVVARQQECLTYTQRHLHWWRANVDHTGADRAPVVVDGDQPLGIRVMQHLYNSQVHMIGGNHEMVQSSLSQLLESLDGRPDYIENDPNLYASIANNLIAFYVYSRRYDEAIALADRVKDLILSRKSRSAQMIKTLLRTFNIELEVYRNTRDFTRANALIADITELISSGRITVPISYLLSFWFQFAYIHFLRGSYRESLTWLNRILNEKDARSELTSYTSAYWLNLVIHAELRSYSVLAYFVDGMRRFLTKRRSIRPFEKILLGFFSRIGRCPESEIGNEFQSLLAQLRSNPANEIPEGVLYHVDFYGWIEAKIVGSR